MKDRLIKTEKKQKQMLNPSFFVGRCYKECWKFVGASVELAAPLLYPFFNRQFYNGNDVCAFIL